MGLPPLPPWPVRSGADASMNMAVVAAIEAGADDAE
jgi:hypothetical protein